jgi:hypothetical protein
MSKTATINRPQEFPGTEEEIRANQATHDFPHLPVG